MRPLRSKKEKKKERKRERRAGKKRFNLAQFIIQPLPDKSVRVAVRAEGKLFRRGLTRVSRVVVGSKTVSNERKRELV